LIFLDEELRMVRKLAEKIVASGAGVLFCQKEIDDNTGGMISTRDRVSSIRVNFVLYS